MLPSLRALLVLFCCTGLTFAANWPAWRGPNGNGHSPEKDLPLTWSTKENVRWKAPLPDQGNSSPIVWGDRVFVTQASKKESWPPKPLVGGGGLASAHHRSLLCFDRKDGKLLWERTTVYKEKESTHPTNPFASASPLTDGERVIASFGSAGMVCYDVEGKELWKVDLGKLEHIWGNASSPIFHGDLCILWCGPGDRQFLLAVDKRTGKEVWRHDEPGGQSGYPDAESGSKGAWLGSWCTPIIAHFDGDEMIVAVPKKLKGFDPKTGKELWSCDGLGNLFYTSPVCSSDGIVVALSGYHGPGMAVKLGGKGDVTKTHRLWHHSKKIPQRIGSPVIIGDHVYVPGEKGPLQCFEVKTGNEVAQKGRLGENKCWSSILAAGGRLYIPNFDGDTFVFSADPKLELLATNSLKEPVLSSIAASDGELFIRTYKHLWCIKK
jgi:outer membrane protein assembly factor BamB